MTDSPDPPPSRQMSPVLFGIGLKIGSTLAFAAMAGCVKYLSSRYPLGQIAFFRSAFAMLPIIVFIMQREEGFRVLRTRRLPGHALRSLSGTAGMFANFGAFSLLPLAESTALFFAAPLFTVALAIPMLGERIGIYRWIATIVGFVGVLLVAHPLAILQGGPDALPWRGVALGLLSAFLGALSVIQTRYLIRSEQSITIVFYFTLGALFVSAVTLFFASVRPSPADLVLLIVMGIFGGIAQIAMTYSFRYADAATLAPFDYLQIVWAAMIGYVVFSALPAKISFIGALVIAASGIFIVLRERAVMRRQEKRR